MSVDIKSGVDSTLLSVDPISKAARVTLYDAQGNVIAIPDKTTLATTQDVWLFWVAMVRWAGFLV